MSLISAIEENEPITIGKRNELYENIRPFAKFINIKGGLSKLKKKELANILSIIKNYPKTNNNNFFFDNQQILLDEEQQKVVTSSTENHMRIIAGAGSGKTTTILCRIKYLIDNITTPDKILVLTFNVDACENLKMRALKLFKFPINLEIRTMDSFCAAVLFKYNPMYKSHSISEYAIDAESFLQNYGDQVCQQYKYVFFDEFQDVNETQFNILKIFIKNNCFLTVIGDDNQNIYQWRGTDNYFIINFDNLISNTKTYTILTNYRSTNSIIEAANKCISYNCNKVDKIMKPATIKPILADLPELSVYEKEHAQLNALLNKIKQFIEESHFSYGDIAILTRTKYWLKICETEFQKNNIPHVALITNDCDNKPQVQENKITLTTIYKSKGLEWPIVFILGVCDTFFPSHINNNIKNIEEERRLFYVAITRAKKYLFFMTNSKEIPLCRFIKEIHNNILYRNITGKRRLDSFETLFDKNNNNIEKLVYSVTDTIKLLTGSDIKELRNKKLIPSVHIENNENNETEIIEQEINEIDTYEQEIITIGLTEEIKQETVSKCVTEEITNPIETIIFEEKLNPNTEIYLNYLEADFSQFCDKYITRLIMINNKQKIHDYAAQYICEGVDLPQDEYEIYEKYKTLFSNPEQKIEFIKNMNDIEIIKRILKKIKPNREVRRIFTYPPNFLARLRQAYKKYINSLLSNDTIEIEIYYVSLCSQFIDMRRRLVYRDVFNIFTKDFDPLRQRMQEYSKLIHGTEIKCKTELKNTVLINSKKITLVGEISLIYDNTLLDFKFSKENLKIEWILQVLIYYAKLKQLYPETNINNIVIFNIFTGKQYTFAISKEYNSFKLLNIIGKILYKNINNAQMSINSHLRMELLSKNENILNTQIEIKQININIQNTENSKNYMCIDVETGKAKEDIIQLSYIIYDNTFKKIKQYNQYIKNRLIENFCADKNKITHNMLEQHGKTFEEVFTEFLFDLNSVQYVIGHNINSDITTIKNDIKKYNVVINNKINSDPFEKKIIYCTMNMGKLVCNLKDKRGRIKNPQLGELYKQLFNKNIYGAHDALYDVINTMECFIKLINKNFETITN